MKGKGTGTEGGNLGNSSMRKGGSDLKYSHVPLYYWTGKKDTLPFISTEVLYPYPGM